MPVQKLQRGHMPSSLRTRRTRLPPIEDTLRVATEVSFPPDNEMPLDVVPKCIQDHIHPPSLIALAAVVGAVPSPLIEQLDLCVVWSAARSGREFDL
jgi:hypothetical protein